MKWYMILLGIVLVSILIFLFFYGRILYKGFSGIYDLTQSEAFQNITKKEGFQNMNDNTKLKLIQSLIFPQEECSTCPKRNEGFQVNVTDLSNVDISGAITSLAALHNIDISNIDVSSITASTISQAISNNSSTASTSSSVTIPDINDSNFQLGVYKNQLAAHITSRDKSKDIGDWKNVRIYNSDIIALQAQIASMESS